MKHADHKMPKHMMKPPKEMGGRRKGGGKGGRKGK